MTLKAVEGQADSRWSTVLASSFENVGADPYIVFTEALADAGSSTKGPDVEGEHTSNCPNPGHNGGSGDQVGSLRWRQAADGQILFTCRATCEGEDVVAALGLTFVQLRWGRTEFYYQNDLRELLAIHVKTPLAGGKKRFWWEHVENGEQVNGRGNLWEPVLWCLPDLQWAAHEASKIGHRVHLHLCYSDDTEVLTPSGWSRFASLPADTQVAQYDKDTEAISFVSPSARQVFDYDGPMVSIRSVHSDLLVTPEHRVLTKYRRAGVKTIRADQVRVHRLLPAAGISIGETTGPSIDQIRVIAAWQADGVVARRGHRMGWNLVKPRKIERLHALLDLAGVPWKDQEFPSWPGHTFVSIDRRNAPWLDALDKQFKWDALSWPLETRLALLQELQYWDGDSSGGGDASRFFTTNKRSADVVNAVAVTSGWSSAVRSHNRPSRPNASTEYVVSLHPDKHWREVSKTPEQVTYAGTKVYCLSVPSTYLVTRRNGKVTISGNCEGEKDALSVIAALERGWVPPERTGDWVDLVTTSPDGAASWSHELTEQVIGLMPALVTILCDNDEAGIKRGSSMSAALSVASNNELTVRTVTWNQPGVRDASDAIQALGPRWLARAANAADADEYAWASISTGWFYEAEEADAQGSGTGRMVLHRKLSPGTKAERPEAVTDCPVRVSAVAYNDQDEIAAWDLECGPNGRFSITPKDLIGGALGSWNSRYGLFGVNTRGVADPFRKYLGFHAVRAPRTVLYPHEGWVDDSRFVTSAGLLIGPAGEQAAVHDTAGLWHYGDGDEQRAAQLLVEILSFRPIEEAAPVIGWLAGVSIRPRALRASGAGRPPMLQVYGRSGTAKTRWTELAVRLFGYKSSGMGDVSRVGLQRSLASSTGPVWIDDAKLDDAINDTLRAAITGGTRTIGNTDGSHTTSEQRSEAAVVHTAENEFKLNERAMRQRSVVVEFRTDVTNRMSQRPEHQGDNARKQYYDLLDLGSSDDTPEAVIRTTGFAGTIVKALWEETKTFDEGYSETAGNREAAGYAFCNYGARVAARWLRSRGFIKEATELVRATRDWAEAATAEAAIRERSGTDQYLATELIPRYLRSSGRSWANHEIGCDVDEDGTATDLALQLAIQTCWKQAQRQAGIASINHGCPVVVIRANNNGHNNEEETPTERPAGAVIGVAVASELLYRWATSEEGRRAGVSTDTRNVSISAIRVQLRGMVTIEDWLGKRLKCGSKDSRNNVTYGLITDEKAIAAITDEQG